MNHLVAISGGKDSTAMALRLVEAEPRAYQFCITPTGRELPEMSRHWNRLECLLGSPLIHVPAPDLTKLILKQKAVPNFRMRWCTRMVKIEPFQAYAMSQAPATCYVGIRADEVIGEDAREGTNWNGIEGVQQNLPLVRWGWGVSKVQAYLAEKGVSIPKRTDCDICYHQRIGEWYRLYVEHPDRFKEGILLEKITGHTLRSEQRDSWATGLKELGDQFASGMYPKSGAQNELEMTMTDRPTMCAWCAR